MGKITVVISKETEEQLRKRIRRKGDMSKMVEDALRVFFDEYA